MLCTSKKPASMFKFFFFFWLLSFGLFAQSELSGKVEDENSDPRRGGENACQRSWRAFVKYLASLNKRYLADLLYDFLQAAVRFDDVVCNTCLHARWRCFSRHPLK
jgi:hypothetical protein